MFNLSWIFDLFHHSSQWVLDLTFVSYIDNGQCKLTQIIKESLYYSSKNNKLNLLLQGPWVKRSTVRFNFFTLTKCFLRTAKICVCHIHSHYVHNCQIIVICTQIFFSRKGVLIIRLFNYTILCVLTTEKVYLVRNNDISK